MALDADDLTAIAEMIAGYAEQEPVDWRDRRAPPMYRRAQIETLERLIVLLSRHVGAERLMLAEIEYWLGKQLEPLDPDDPKQVQAITDYDAGRQGTLVSVRGALYGRWDRRKERVMDRWLRMKGSKRRHQNTK